MTDLRTQLVRDFATELDQPLANLLAAAKGYGASVDRRRGRSDAWGECQFAGHLVYEVLHGWRPLGIGLEDVVSEKEAPGVFFLAAAAYALSTASDETYPQRLKLFRRCALGAGRR